MLTTVPSDPRRGTRALSPLLLLGNPGFMLLLYQNVLQGLEKFPLFVFQSLDMQSPEFPKSKGGGLPAGFSLL